MLWWNEKELLTVVLRIEEFIDKFSVAKNRDEDRKSAIHFGRSQHAAARSGWKSQWLHAIGKP